MRMLRPLALGDIFDEAFDLYKDHFASLLLVAIAAALPLELISGVIEYRFLRGFQGLTSLFGGSLPDITQIYAVIGSVAGTLAILAPIYAIGFGLQTTALAAAAAAHYLGDAVTLKSVYTVPLRRIGPLVLSALLFGLCIALGASICYVGIAIPFTIFAFTAHAFAVEGKTSWRFWQPLARSRALVAGHGGRIFGALCVLSVVYFILTLGIQLPLSYALHALFGLVPGGQSLLGASSGVQGVSIADQLINQICSVFSGITILPFMISVLTVLYFDLRVRKEAFDIELLARDLRYPIRAWFIPSTPRKQRRMPRPSPPAKGIPT